MTAFHFSPYAQDPDTHSVRVPRVQVSIPRDLLAHKYPTHMEKEKDVRERGGNLTSFIEYESKSVLGQVHKLVYPQLQEVHEGVPGASVHGFQNEKKGKPKKESFTATLTQNDRLMIGLLERSCGHRQRSRRCNLAALMFTIRLRLSPRLLYKCHSPDSLYTEILVYLLV